MVRDEEIRRVGAYDNLVHSFPAADSSKVEKRATPTWSLEGNATWYPGGSSGMSAYPSTSTCLFQRNDTTHQFLSDGNGDLCGSFRCEL